MNSVNPKQQKKWHDILPIDKDEPVLGVYNHHIVAYVGPFLSAIVIVIVLVGISLLMTASNTTVGESIIPSQYHTLVHMLAAVLSIVTLLFSFIPIWLRSQEHIVLTDEAVLQVLQPGLFAGKVSQTSLERVADISVHENFFGTIFGYGRLTIETAGEQDNYDYAFLPHARDVARQIIETQESFMIALEGGHLTPESYHQKNTKQPADPPQQIVVDPEQYAAFLQYQQEQSAAQETTKPEAK